jgi:hypothetical protein
MLGGWSAVIFRSHGFGGMTGYEKRNILRLAVLKGLQSSKTMGRKV